MSVAPILAVPGVQAALAAKPIVAVSPIIGGQALKGPAAKMFSELGILPSALAVAQHYGSLLRGFIFDEVDAAQSEAVAALGIMPLVTATVMKDRNDRAQLAREVLAFGSHLLA